MSVQSQLVREALRRPQERPLGGDLRRHRRLPLEVQGRFLMADRNEHSCKSRDISVGGARLSSSVQPQIGERVVLYFDILGGLEATVTRHISDGFAVFFNITENKREKLAAQIMWLANRDSFPDHAGRTHERVGAGGRRTTLQLDEGVTIDVELMDLSASGASIGTTARPAIGELVYLGRLPAVVRRQHEQGVGLQFITLQTQETLKRHFG